MDYRKTIDFIKSVYGNQNIVPLAVPVFIGNEKKYLNECFDIDHRTRAFRNHRKKGMTN